MSDYGIEKHLNERKKKILDIVKVFLAVMLLLTFFSKTIYSWTLPKVKYEAVSAGSLTAEIMGEGTVEAKGRVEYYTDIKVAVKDVMVSAGDEVKQGDELFILEKDSLNGELERKKLELVELKLQYDQMYREEEANTREQRLHELKTDLTHREKVYSDYKLLYEKGAESKSSLEEKRMEYEAAKAKYESAEKELSVEAQNNKKEIEAQMVGIQIKELELREIEKKLDKCVITAPFDGIIKEINFKKGMMLNDAMPVYILDNIGDGFEFKADLAVEQCEYINPGDEVKVYIKNREDSQLDGIVKTISTIKDSHDMRSVTVDLGKTELAGGEAGEFYLRKKAGTYDYLVPRSAIHKDSEGAHVYVLQEKDGPLGIEYYAIKQKVAAGDSDYSYTGIYSGLLGDERVIVSSSKDLYDGCQVILEK
ncbi:MAG: efflux RND transporter periplasmic adaptor subunit [Caulobacteraceae bacterium]